MSVEEMSRLDVKALAHPDGAALLMWVTSPKLDQAFTLIRAWGFTYKTVLFNWVKTNKCDGLPKCGLGYYTRSATELVLLATRGKCERKSKCVRQVLLEHPREHSRKPDEIRTRIEQLFGDVPRIEMFARTRTPGWDVWGNEVDKF